MVKSNQSFSLNVTNEEAGMRLDLFLVNHLPEYSRSALNKLIRDGAVVLDGKSVKAGYRIRYGECVQVDIPDEAPSELVPEKIDFPVLYEDESILVITKPPGLVVHPAAGHGTGTLVHGLLFHCNDLPGIDEGRPGIVHRLDKDTSGVMLVAKNDKALRKLTRDFRDREVEKTYHAILLRGPRESSGRIVEPIGRHPVNRKKMAVVRKNGRYAATNWSVVESFENGMCLVEVGLETGRTHQIRVHMAYIGCPVVGDGTYGGQVVKSSELDVKRQLLHSSTVRFSHPETGKILSFTSPLWDDMNDILEVLRA